MCCLYCQEINTSYSSIETILIVYNVFVHYRSGRDRCVKQRRFGTYDAVVDFIGSLDWPIDRIHVIYDTAHD